MLDFSELMTPGHVQPPPVILRSFNDNMDWMNRACGRRRSMLQVETKF
ncbi:hypothetical protein CSC43_4127 [Pseudomonas aeruginosa]|nr:hypothetical protein CSB94_2048 [Pseudomonas aeruginosa]AVK14869.1 hypothetical protein CSB91_4071 [Pseudomonas aeruginosa]RCH31759.1 hypothetical protein CSC43_4127 [Pseudomonas aeruginosa]CDH80382.1 hypothetical protein PAMH27_6037 [Pseudomonas aeruginosa MH27]